MLEFGLWNVSGESGKGHQNPGERGCERGSGIQLTPIVNDPRCYGGSVAAGLEANGAERKGGRQNALEDAQIQRL